MEPRPEQLPFDLAGYRPDIVAVRDDGGLIIELKRTDERLSIDRYVEVAALVRQHPGWRFYLVPTDRLEESELWTLLTILPREEIQQRAEAAVSLLRSGMYLAAFVTAWSGVEGLLRRLAEENAIPVASLSPVALIKHLYSQGFLSMTQLRELEALMQVRNRVVHGLADPRLVDATPRLVDLFIGLLRGVEPTRPAL